MCQAGGPCDHKPANCNYTCYVQSQNHYQARAELEAHNRDVELAGLRHEVANADAARKEAVAHMEAALNAAWQIELEQAEVGGACCGSCSVVPCCVLMRRVWFKSRGGESLWVIYQSSK
jgi:hypothetical protein